jgi:hypothetical protein
LPMRQQDMPVTDPSSQLRVRGRQYWLLLAASGDGEP